MNEDAFVIMMADESDDRLANLFIRILFRIKLNDTTNAFKAYRRQVIDGCRPFLSPHFNLTVELPLKAIVRGYSWTISRPFGETVVPVYPSSRSKRWEAAIFSFVCTCGSKKYFSRGDYRKEVNELGSKAGGNDGGIVKGEAWPSANEKNAFAEKGSGLGEGKRVA